MRIALGILLIIPVITYGAGFLKEEGGFRAAASTPDECWNLDKSTGMECANFFAQETDVELGKAWARLTSKVKEDSALLEASQQRWSAYVAAQCVLESTPARSYSQPDWYAHFYKSICRSRLNLLRIQELERQSTDCAGCIR